LVNITLLKVLVPVKVLVVVFALLLKVDQSLFNNNPVCEEEELEVAFIY
jgi:hypothetical protein